MLSPIVLLDSYAPLKSLASTSLLSRQTVLSVSKPVCSRPNKPDSLSYSVQHVLQLPISIVLPLTCSDLSVLTCIRTGCTIWSLLLIGGHAAVDTAWDAMGLPWQGIAAGLFLDSCLPRPPHSGALLFS